MELLPFLLGFVGSTLLINFGFARGYKQGRIDAAVDLVKAQDEISKTLRLAEITGIDTSKLTPDEIIKLVLERRKSTQDD